MNQKKQSRRNVITIHDAYFHNLISLLTTPLAEIPSVRGGTSIAPFQVWDYLGMPLQDLCSQKFGFSAEDVAYNGAILRGLNKRLVRDIVLTQELKEHLGISPDIGFDPIEWPVAWRGVMVILPQPAPNIPRRRKRKSVTLERQTMREVLDRYRATLHQQIDDEFNGLYKLVQESPELAARLIQELIRLGY